MGKLVHFHADGSAAEIKLDRQRITIGRRADNDFCLPYPAVSGEHAAVVTILADSFLEDLGSTNGTLVNGAAVTKHFLRDRDEIDVGQQVLIYVVDDTATLEALRRKGKPVEDIGNRDSADGTLVGPAALRAKRRSDFVTPAPTPSPGVLLQVVANGDDASHPERTAPMRAPPLVAAPDEIRTPGPGAADAAPAPPPRQQIDAEPALRVVSGAKAGRIVALVKDETLIGRAGVQVVALRRGADEVRVVPVEGAAPPSVNGIQVVPEGRSLAVGDILEVAGTKLEVIAAIKRSSV